MEGNITTTALENGGAVRGDIHAGGHIRLSEKSQVSGDITAASISVDQDKHYDSPERNYIPTYRLPNDSDRTFSPKL